MKRLLSVLLAVCLFLTCIPIAALAEEPQGYSGLVLRALEPVEGGWTDVSPTDPGFFSGVYYPKGTDDPAVLGLGGKWYAAAYILENGQVIQGPLHPDSLKGNLTGNVEIKTLQETGEGPAGDNADRLFCIIPTAEADDGQSFTLKWGGDTSKTATYDIALPESGFYREPPRSKANILSGEMDYTVGKPIEFYLITESSVASWMQDDVAFKNQFPGVNNPNSKIEKEHDGVYKITITLPDISDLGSFDVCVGWTMKNPNDESDTWQSEQRLSLHPARPESDDLPLAAFYKSSERNAENLIDTETGFEYTLGDESTHKLYFLVQAGVEISDVQLEEGTRFVEMAPMQSGNGYEITIKKANVANFSLGMRWTEYNEGKHLVVQGHHTDADAMPFITQYFKASADDTNLTRLEAIKILIGMREALFPPYPPENRPIDYSSVTALNFTNMDEINALDEADQIILKKAVAIKLLYDVNNEFKPNETVPRYEMAALLAEITNIGGRGFVVPSEEEYSTFPENVSFSEGSENYTDRIKFLCWKTDYVNSPNREVTPNTEQPNFMPRKETTRKVAVEWAYGVYQYCFRATFLDGDRNVSEFSDSIIMLRDENGKQYQLLPETGWQVINDPEIGWVDTETLPTGVSYDPSAKTMTLTNATLKLLEVNGRNMPDFSENDLPAFKLVLSGENKVQPVNTYGINLMMVKPEITGNANSSLLITPYADRAVAEHMGIWVNGSEQVVTTISGGVQVKVASTYSDDQYRRESMGYGFQGTGSLIVKDSAKVDLTPCGRMGLWDFLQGITIEGSAQVKTDYIQTDTLTVKDTASLEVTPDYPEIRQSAINARKVEILGGTMTVTEGQEEGQGPLGPSMVALGARPEDPRTDGGYYQSGGVVTITTGGKHGYQNALDTERRLEVTGGTLNVTGRRMGIVLGPKATGRVTGNSTVNVSALGVNNGIVPADGFPVTFALYLNGPIHVDDTSKINATASGGLYGSQGVTVKAGNGNRGELTVEGGTHTFKGIGDEQGDNYGIYGEELGNVYVTGGTVTVEGGNCAAFANRPGADNCSITVGDGMHIVDHSNGANDPGTELAFLTNSFADSNSIQQNTYFLRKNNDANANMAVTKAVISAAKGSDPWATGADVSLRAQGGSATAGSLISMVAEVNATVGTKSLLTVSLPTGVSLESGSITLDGEKLTDILANISVIGPGTLRFSVRAAEAKTYTVTADAKAGLAQEVLDTATCDLTVFPSFSINYPPFVSDKAEKVSVTGTAAPGSNVTLKAPAGGGPDTSITVTSTGTYSANIDLANYSGGWDGDKLKLEAWTGGAKQEDVVITYLSGQPKLTSFDVLNYVKNGKKRYKDRVHYAHGAQDSGTEAKNARASASYIYWPGEDELEFEVKFHTIPESYQRDLRVRLTLSNGQTADSNLSYTSKGKKWDGGYTIQNENLPVGFTVVSLSGGTVIWSSEYISMTPIIDPSGYIYEGTKDNRVEGAAATLYYIADQPGKPTGGMGSGTLWADAEKYLQINPLTTGADGSFAWNVPVGWWRVQAEKDGLTGTSDWMHVLPAQTGLEIGLTSSDPAELTSIVRSEDGKYLTLTFSRPVGVKDVYSETLPIEDKNGQVVPGCYYPENGDTENASIFSFVPEGSLPPKYVLGRLAADSVTTYNEQTVAAAEVRETDPPEDDDDGPGGDTPTPGPAGPSGPSGDDPADEPTITENPDGSTTTTETAEDGTVTATTTWDDGRQAVAVKTPEGEKTINVTEVNGEKSAEISIPATPGAGKEFEDVKSGAWYESAVNTTTGYGLFSGTSDTKFSPNDGMTRAMLATVLHNLSGSPVYGTDTNVFEDVESGKWYEDPVDWAYKIGVTSGTSATEFSPNKDITREQLVTMLYRYAEKIGAASKNRKSIDTFPDGNKVAGYAKDAMRWAVAEGFISGRANGGKNYIAPQGTATRAEVAAVLTRFVEYLKK